jgi:hypothetical protein
MTSNWFTRTIARIVLGSYLTQLFAPVVYACENDKQPIQFDTIKPLLNSPRDEVNLRDRLSQGIQPFVTLPHKKPSLKVNPKGLSPSVTPVTDLPTLMFRLKQVPSNTPNLTYRLSIKQTRLLGEKGLHVDYHWSQDFSLVGSGPSQNFITHPWMRYLKLHLSDGGQLTAESLLVTSTKETLPYYQGCNYVFKMDGNVHLKNLFTNGWVDVKQAQHVSAEGAVEGQQGIHLKATSGICTRSKDPKQPTRLFSNKRIALEAPALDTQDSFLKAPLIHFYSDEGAFTYSPNGLHAKELLSFTSRNKPITLTVPLKMVGAFEATAPEVLNQTTLVAKGEVTLTGTSQTVDYPIRNEGDIQSTQKGLTVNAKGFSHTKGQLNLAKDLTFPGENLTLRSPTVVGGTLPITAKGKRDIDFSQLDVQRLLKLTLPTSQNTLTKPIKIAGQLDIDREGNSSTPFHILSDLIARKGLKVRIPPAPILVGSEDEKVPMVKLQTAEGFLDIEARSLDLIKAQIFAKTGMRWEVQEKQMACSKLKCNTI